MRFCSIPGVLIAAFISLVSPASSLEIGGSTMSGSFRTAAGFREEGTTSRSDFVASSVEVIPRPEKNPARKTRKVMTMTSREFMN